MMSVFDQLIETAKAIRLRGEAKTKTKQDLEAFMALHPAVVAPIAPAQPKGSFVNLSSFFSIFSEHHGFVYSGALAAFLLATTTSIGLAAQASLPGDRLYPVKISITEPLRSLLVPTGQARVLWETERAELRLSEAEMLASQDLLRGPVQEVVQTAYKIQSDALSNYIDELAKVDSPAAATALTRREIEIKTHENILSLMAADKTKKDPAAVIPLLELVRSKSQEVVKQREAADAAIARRSAKELKPLVKARLLEATNAVAVGRKFLGNSKARLSAEEAGPLEGALISAERQIAEAKTVGSRNLAMTYLGLGKVQRDAKIATAIAKSKVALRLNIPVTIVDPSTGAGVNGLVPNSVSNIGTNPASPVIAPIVPAPAAPPVVIKIDLGL